MWYAVGMYILALTGGLGSGKSTAAEYFRERGAVVLDLDEIASRILSKGSPALERVADEFGRDDVLLADGSIDRPALARIAFSSREAASRLNALVHPAVASEVGPALREIRLMPNQPDVVVLEVPLLVEAPVFAEMADEVLAIVAPEQLRIARATSRGMSESDARRRILSQATDAERADMADEVIANDGDEESFLRALSGFWDRHIAGPRTG